MTNLFLARLRQPDSSLKILSASPLAAAAVYPVPARENCWVQVPENWSGSLLLSDLFGRIVMKRAVGPGEAHRVSFAVSLLPAGTYLLTGPGLEARRIVVWH